MLSLPSVEYTAGELAEASEIRRAILGSREVSCIRPERIAPWELLCYLSDAGDFAFHGTTDLNIAEFTPRKCQDANPFGAQEAVFASSDGLWAMFYAVLDRPRQQFSMVNSCASFVDEDGSVSKPCYFFSIGAPSESEPFSPGAVYVLPLGTFSRDPIEQWRGHRVVVHHWASLEPVRPLAILPVAPEDFPFLDQIRRHDDEVLRKRIDADPDGFPWVD
ncbi:MAG TPA: hypothetical protein VG944_03165 [Fimbriimonas sp.]|nr:hypothetical protein [Fimbriimonas sp.]